MLFCVSPVRWLQDAITAKVKEEREEEESGLPFPPKLDAEVSDENESLEPQMKKPDPVSESQSPIPSVAERVQQALQEARSPPPSPLPTPGSPPPVPKGEPELVTPPPAPVASSPGVTDTVVSEASQEFQRIAGEPKYAAVLAVLIDCLIECYPLLETQRQYDS